ncbi:BAK1-Associating Receptor-Like Kinase 1 [Hibiscus trionum]|uniref:non-specific serine/threonine protein kinase n=1 Tax=Hibiscus trionum TaxID=183268 RepID=A0A9W7H7Y4_HIBTR|nr:BAK1-Associating Receptor-Like Kinase 1 [Hibiscus trionum]
MKRSDRHRQNQILLRLLIVSSVLVSAADDSAAIQKIASGFRNAPKGWSSTSTDNYCNWQGLSCDKSNRVTYISLASKAVSGTLAPEIANLSALRGVSLQRNSLSGNIPSFGTLSNLQNLFLDFNAFTSITPDAFAGLSSIQTLSLGENPKLGPWTFPNVSGLTTLVELGVGNANIYGTLPDIFGSLSSLQSLRASYNNLNGTLPSSLGGSMIQKLWINNQNTGFGFTGTLEVLSNMTQLAQAWVHVNSFTGPIPDLSKCESLFDLQIRDNQLTGPVPASLFNLSSLKNVSIDNNKLQGPFPMFPSTVERVQVNGSNNFCNTNGAPCDPQVSTLIEIAGGFGYPILLSDNWEGNDACEMSFVTCDSNKSVITVNLAKKGLSGKISPAFGDLKGLKNLNLNDNNLTGPIPDSLTKLAYLQLLDVSNNDLSGEIPKFSTSVKFIISGNSLLQKPVFNSSGGSGNVSISPSSSSGGGSSDSGGGTSSSGGGSAGNSTVSSHTVKGKTSKALIVGIAAGAVVFLGIICFVSFKFIMKKKDGKLGNMEKKDDAEKGVVKTVATSVGKSDSEHQSLSSTDQSSSQHLFEGGNVVISMDVLREVTNNFSEDNILGKGGFGVVYKGELHDGTQIAVKRMECVDKGTKGLDEFHAEIAVLSKVRHRHLVALLGYCINGNERLLVYEHMPRGTLSRHLFRWQRKEGGSPLTWKQRLIIALDVARGVEYLHSLAQQSFIHRDLKPSNILLGDDMRAKVADFGLVRNAPDGKHSLETRLAGTFGYLAPEYATTGRVTTKVDVYAFGVVLMELITGRKALDETLPEEESHLVTWFRRVLINRDEIPKTLDETIKCDVDGETMVSILKVAELAGHCTVREPSQRPDMGHAVNVLSPLVQQWKPTSQKEDETVGIDLDLSLSQALQRWQTSEGDSSTFGDTSLYGTQTSTSEPGYTWSSSDTR